MQRSAERLRNRRNVERLPSSPSSSSPSASSSEDEKEKGDEHCVGSGGAAEVAADASHGTQGDDADPEDEDDTGDGLDLSGYDPAAAAAAAAAAAKAEAEAAAAEAAEKAAAIAAAIAAAEAQAATEAAADAMLGAPLPDHLVRASGDDNDDDDEKTGDGELRGSSASKWNPLTCSHILLRWLLSANRAHLRPLGSDEAIPEIPCAKQFVLVTGTAEREANFQRLKRECGTFYAFHGSKPDNWHAILHLGLKNMSDSKYMSSGAAYGKGIYMADQLQVSLGYAGGGGTQGWPMARTSGAAVIVAVCEVVDRFLVVNPTPPAGSRAISARNLTLKLQDMCGLRGS